MEQEKTIIQEVLAGVDRYEALVTAYHVGLIIHCERLVGDRADAEDIAQEAFVKAYMQLSKFDPSKARFSTWLYRIATNLAVDFLRSRKRHIDVDDIETVAETTMPRFIEEERELEIIRAVEALKPPEFRQVIEAYYWRGESYQEIAKAMDTPLNTVRSRIRRAKQQLKEVLS
jgi:RNA polymerase sigma-70 factor (ECF subfamily)